VSSYGQDQARLIADQVAAGTVVAQKMGTVISRETATARASVSFDGGSGNGQPVKCFETVVCDSGDRVGLIKFEGEWIIVGNYTPRTLGHEISYTTYVGTAPTYAGSTFQDMPSSPEVNIKKMRDDTQFMLHIAGSLRADASSTVYELALNITFPNASTSDESMLRRVLNAAADHRDYSAGHQTTGTFPAGSYTFVGRWRRISGTGNLTIDVNDTVTIEVEEVVP
jgi:hypothetical protein